ncbi:hypothetical protein ACRN96_18345 [Shewanella oncorhynchi]|uniref:hypothetical protein n=1 Tax=Shewanella oncorhynchi TaxID=2726434 RepID=UPI003D7B9390
MANPEWVSDCFGIVPHFRGGRWVVVYGDNDLWAYNGIYRNRRRAKKRDHPLHQQRLVQDAPKRTGQTITGNCRLLVMRLSTSTT